MNIVRKTREHQQQFADRPAILDANRTWTHSEFYERVDRLSNALLNTGLKKGDRLLCWLPNVREALETELACLQTGAVWVTLNAGLTWPEVEAVIGATTPAIFVTDPALLHRIQPASPDTLRVLANATLVLQGGECEQQLFGKSLAYEQGIAAASPETPRVDITENDVARLRYTSGTTGAAKAAILSHRAYLGSLVNQREHLHPLDESDRVLHAAPLTHASAALAYPILAAGGANVILPAFEAEAVLEAIERHHITTMFAVPTMLQRLAASPSFATRDLSSLRTISYGGAPMPAQKLSPLLDRLGPIFMQIYGLTEALHPVTCLQRHEHVQGNPKLASAGTLTSTCRIKIVDDAEEVEDGAVGELLIKGPITFDGYWRDPEETRKTLRDGWVASGDLGYRDVDGYYWIVDRKKNVIISGGFNVYAGEVESALHHHPAVADAVVVGLPHDDWGEMVHAVVHLRDGERISETELLAWCRQRLAGYKTPKGVTFTDQPLPRNSAGKVARRDVFALLTQSDGARR